jgi:hypothetical protein
MGCGSGAFVNEGGGGSFAVRSAATGADFFFTVRVTGASAGTGGVFTSDTACTAAAGATGVVWRCVTTYDPINAAAAPAKNPIHTLVFIALLFIQISDND